MWDELRDMWEWDSHSRRMILAAVIIGAIGFAFALLEIGAQRQWGSSQ